MSRSSSRARSASHTPPAATPARAKGLRRSIAWWAIAVTAVVIITAAFATDAVRDAETFAGVGEARLSVSAGYLAIAPISAILDNLTLLQVGQHIAIMLTAIGLFALWRVRRSRRAPVVVRREIIAAIGMLAGLVLVYAALAVMPRPMASLVVSDELVVAVDFHAHTKYSHDGRFDWDEDDVREWHRAAGYDAVYITDHASFTGAERGIAANPPVAGLGTVVLQGLEAWYHGEHVNVLSAGRHFKGLTNATLTDVDTESLALASMIQRSAPVLIETVPANLSKVPASTPDHPVGVQAIEIVDGSPRGLSQGRAERKRIVHLADSLNLALVTGTDNHGWGRAAPAWTLVRIGGWRGMRSDSLSQMIERVLREGRRGATRAIERNVAGASNPIEFVFAAPLVAWRMFTTLSADERVMWIIWAWGIVLARRGWRMYRERSVAARASAA